LLEHENEDFKQQGPINDYGIYGIFNPNQQRTRKTDSASIEYRTKLDQGSIFAVSSRYDKNSQFKNGTTARVELILPLSKSFKLKGSYGTAIKNPTFTERFGYYTNFIGNPDLQPEYSKNLELGFDFDLQNYNSF
jgi:vitamin B12 transporter